MGNKLRGVFRILQMALIVLLALDLVGWVFWAVFCAAIGVEAAVYVAETEVGDESCAD